MSKDTRNPVVYDPDEQDTGDCADVGHAIPAGHMVQFEEFPNEYVPVGHAIAALRRNQQKQTFTDVASGQKYPGGQGEQNVDEGTANEP